MQKFVDQYNAVLAKYKISWRRLSVQKSGTEKFIQLGDNTRATESKLRDNLATLKEHGHSENLFELFEECFPTYNTGGQQPHPVKRRFIEAYDALKLSPTLLYSKEQDIIYFSTGGRAYRSTLEAIIWDQGSIELSLLFDKAFEGESDVCQDFLLAYNCEVLCEVGDTSETLTYSPHEYLPSVLLNNQRRLTYGELTGLVEELDNYDVFLAFSKYLEHNNKTKFNEPKIPAIPLAPTTTSASNKEITMKTTASKFFSFFKTAAIEGAKDGASRVATDAMVAVARKYYEPYVPRFVRKLKFYRAMEDLLVPTGLMLAADIWGDKLPNSKAIGDIAGRSARTVFSDQSRVILGGFITPMFKELSQNELLKTFTE